MKLQQLTHEESKQAFLRALEVAGYAEGMPPMIGSDAAISFSALMARYVLKAFCKKNGLESPYVDD